jgi:hypothetical protein
MTGTVVDEIVAKLGMPYEQISLSLHNLTRLGCFHSEQNLTYLLASPAPAQVSPWTQGWPWIAAPEASYHLTGLGYAIVEACRGASVVRSEGTL